MASEDGTEASSRSALPRPFYDAPWTGDRQEAARAFWHWHHAMWSEEAGKSWHPDDVDRATRRSAISWIDSDVSQNAYVAVDRNGLNPALLASQVRAVPLLRPGLRVGDPAELDALANDLAGSHAVLLAALGDAAHSWQIPWVESFARGLFLTGRLMRLSEDIGADRWFIPQIDMEQAGVERRDLASGNVTESVRRLLWKQSLRARDALAQAIPLAGELDRGHARTFKLWWMAAVEVLGTIERRRFDVWSRPIELTPWQRVQVHFQSRFGRTTFRSVR